jgi:hypothetical protein
VTASTNLVRSEREKPIRTSSAAFAAMLGKKWCTPAPPSSTPDWTIGSGIAAGSSWYQNTAVRSTGPTGRPPECANQRRPFRKTASEARVSPVSIVVEVPACAAPICDESKSLATAKRPLPAMLEPGTTDQTGAGPVPVIRDRRTRCFPETNPVLSTM